ncbi:hypothetical protein KZ810_05135 [Sphingomonas sp. RHCKR47]|uniref:hypothetical protein n=1 Tax=Sphingomonas citricola TaxID=2862498 RepID=UPI001CA4DC00|nr:hypothetical protein [Sphingomonas citricola]MBW6522875.1 hypothetical protein [Sphingomonas citricola]
MAYIDFASEQDQLLSPAPRHDPVPVDAPATQLSALEWSVVAIARNDRLSSLREPSRLSVAMGGLFGARHNPRLADPRLEALRRMAVLSWHHGYTVPTSALTAFTDAGFTIAQYETLMASIASSRLTRKPQA